MLDCLGFQGPDKIPVVYHPSTAGLYVHGQKLLDLFRQFPPDNNVEFGPLPVPKPGTIDQDGRYHEISKNEWGTTWEYLIFGIAGHPKTYPINSWEQAPAYQFPPVPVLAAEARQRIRDKAKDHLVIDGWITLFEKMQELCPIDEVLAGLGTEEPGLMGLLDRLVEYREKEIREWMDAGVDGIMFADDWGTQTSTLVSPKLFTKVFKSRYQRLMAPLKAAGKKIYFHSCGFLGKIFDEVLDLGVDCLWPQIVIFESDPRFSQACLEHRVSIYIHPDRQRLIPLGTPREIEDTVKRYADKYRSQAGGGIFYVEMENDASFENVEALIRSIHKYR